MTKVTEKPFAPSCERNQQVIFDVLNSIIRTDDKHILELGSGTGQHAVFMAPQLPNVTWHTSELLENHQGIKQWLAESDAQNIKPPLHYQAGSTAFPGVDADFVPDVVMTVNTLHIMSWACVQTLIKDLGQHLKAGARVLIYGPFNYDGEFTSDSNADFDIWLKNKDALSGIRDFEAVCELMQAEQIKLLKDVTMPANNRCLVFNKC
ncbi:DUF938 domain-containing protein [Marinicella rhabdoformis]|uniref:DUF938 domain-containing protein n=1 Tax=Marinicella rhabdoformis TaxID=2580566 RepID=UPI0012AEC64C|nr:DUF938 domain-containing protein [Marinicella rhabdoformis]